LVAEADIAASCQLTSGRRPFEQGNALGSNRLLVTDRPDSLSGLGLQPDPVAVTAEEACQPLPYRLAVWKDFGPLGKDDAIQIPQLPAGGPDFFPGHREHVGRFPAAVGRIGVGEQLTNVAEPHRPQQGVGHGVQQDVGVRVADSRLVVRQLDAAQPEAVAWFQPVGVVAESDPVHHSLSSSG